MFGNSGQRNDWWSLRVQGEKIPELGKEIKGLKLKTNEPPLGLDTNLSEQGPVTLEELLSNAMNFQHCQTWRVNVLGDCHQLHCNLLFSSFYSSSAAEIQTQPPRCCANTGQETPSASRASDTACSEKHPNLSHLGVQRAGSGRGAGLWGRCRASMSAPALSLPCAASPQGFPCLPQESDMGAGKWHLREGARPLPRGQHPMCRHKHRWLFSPVIAD